MDPTIPAGRTRETEIRRDKLGRWFNGEDRITHPNLLTAFDRWLEIAPDGRYCLKNDINWAYVEVEGAPRFVKRVRLIDDDLLLSLSDGTEARLAEDTLKQDENGLLYCLVHGGTMVAAFETRAMDDLADRVDEDETGVFLRIHGQRLRPPVVADPLAHSDLPAELDTEAPDR